MSRFYTEGEIKKYDAKLKTSETTDISNLKTKLKEDINREYHRVNVDSAKKKAVLQRMDYDGFHQMVLGADLKGMRPEEIIYVDFKKNEKVLNNHKIRENLIKPLDVLENVFVNTEEKDVESINSKEVKIELDFKETSIDLFNKLNNLTNEETDQALIIYFQIHKKIKFDEFFRINSSIEPKFFIETIKHIYSIIELLNSGFDDKELFIAIVDVINALIAGLKKITILPKLKMFVSSSFKKSVEAFNFDLNNFNINKIKTLVEELILLIK